MLCVRISRLLSTLINTEYQCVVSIVIQSRSPNLDSQSLDKRGLLWIIDEEAISSGSSDDTFLNEILHEHGNEGDIYHTIPFP